MKCQSEHRDAPCPNEATVRVATDYGPYQMCGDCAAEYSAAGMGDPDWPEPEVDDSVKCCPGCETPNQFGELCNSCREAEAEEARRFTTVIAHLRRSPASAVAVLVVAVSVCSVLLTSESFERREDSARRRAQPAAPQLVASTSQARLVARPPWLRP